MQDSVAFKVLAGLALAAATAAGQEVNSTWLLEQFRGTHVSFGACLDSELLYVNAFTKRVCPERDEVIQAGDPPQPYRLVTKWVTAYEDEAALEADLAAVPANNQFFWAALNSDTGLVAFDAALQQGFVLDYLTSLDGTVWAWVVQSSAEAVAATAQVKAFIPVPSRMKMDPLALFFQSLSSSDVSTRENIMSRFQHRVESESESDTDGRRRASSPELEFEVSTLPNVDVKELAERWNAAAVASPRTAARGRSSVRAVDGRVKVSAMDEAEFLAEQAEVTWVHVVPKYRLLNEDAAALLQSGFIGTAAQKNDDLTDKMTIWNRGITGAGQVVGIGDSGLDTSQCMFASATPADDLAATNARAAAIAELEDELKPDLNARTFNYPAHRKVVQYTAWVDHTEGTRDGHGTHVAGTVAGSPIDLNANGYVLGPRALTPDGSLNTEGTYLDVKAATRGGMAPGARIAFMDVGAASSTDGALSPPNKASDLVGPAKDAGAFLHTNSWGSDGSVYDQATASLDSYLFLNQDFMILFAAGNAGGNGAGSIGSPGTAKNIITVGASAQTERNWALDADLWGPGQCDARGGSCAHSMAPFSSRGPTPDGRIKPDVVAPGYYITSSFSSDDGSPTCNFLGKPGTSMATPVVAGIAALVRQWYTDGYFVAGVEDLINGIKPMGALIKASLVYSADLLQGYFANSNVALGYKPNSNSGFGIPVLTNLMGVDAATYVPPKVVGDYNNMEVLATGETYTATFTATAETALIRAVLVWSDAPASVTSRRQIVNDLDLTVTTPGGDVLYPNGLEYPDRANVVEKIDILTPVAGEYTITVTGTSVVLGPQPFALIFGGALPEANTPVDAATADAYPPPEGMAPINMTENAVPAAGDDDDDDDDDDGTGGDGDTGDDDVDTPDTGSPDNSTEPDVEANDPDSGNPGTGGGDGGAGDDDGPAIESSAARQLGGGVLLLFQGLFSAMLRT